MQPADRQSIENNQLLDYPWAFWKNRSIIIQKVSPNFRFAIRIRRCRWDLFAWKSLRYFSETTVAPRINDFWVWFCTRKTWCFQRALTYVALHSPWVLVVKADINWKDFPPGRRCQVSKGHSFDSKQVSDVWIKQNCSARKYFDKRLVKFIDYTINLENSLSRYRFQRWQSIFCHALESKK